MSNNLSNVSIVTFMKTLLNDYKQLRGKKKDSCGKKFWDLVVLTTSDGTQHEAFQMQVEEKLQRHELPTDLPIIIVPDPPGPRIGNGGSTLHALEHLQNIYGSAMYTMKILMIHAGGWSQRMPSATALGKIFSLIPYGNPPYQMLDLKLALFWPFVERIDPGVFLVCADDFLLYSLVLSRDWKIPSKGFTALAHPSPIHIGRTHGVFVINDMEKINPEDPVVLRPCVEVLQKPTDERMKAQGAILKRKFHEFSDGIRIEGDMVYTDSSFYFGTDIVEKLVQFKKSTGALSCEIDAYGDFLQALGSRATNGYIHLTSNVSQLTSNLSQVRQNVFDCLKGSDLHVLILNASVFVHIGTTRELLYHFCQDKVFQNRMNLSMETFNSWHSQNPSPVSLSLSQKISGRDHQKISKSACIMHSALHSSSVVEDNCVVEYCDFEVLIHIHQNCILSNCQVTQSAFLLVQPEVFIPERTFLHTVPVSVNDDTMFVTVFFSVDDDLKKSASTQDVNSLPFMEYNIDHYVRLRHLLPEDILPSNYQEKSDGNRHGSGDKLVQNDKISLWNLKLFPAQSSMSASFLDAARALSKEEMPRPKSSKLFSLADLIKFKDVRAMLHFRKVLFDGISSSQSGVSDVLSVS